MVFFRLEMLHVKFLILLILTASFIFLPCSESSGGEAEDEYHGVYVVSSCKNFDNATALVDRLRAKGYDSFCKTVNIPNKGQWHRVYVKQYGNREEALLAGKELREKGVLKSFWILKAETEDNPALAKMEVEGTISPAPDSAEKRPDSPNTKEAALLPDKKVMPPIVKEAARPANKEVIPQSTKVIALPDKEDQDVKTGGSRRSEVGSRRSEVGGRRSEVGGLYDSAMSDFTSGRYKDALSKFKEIIKTEKNEAAMRRIADCCYFLGKKGDKRHVLEAIDQYRDIIRNYTGPNKENAQAVYRLAESYSRLNFHYEALMEFKNLCSKYPESDYIPESLYMMGEMYYQTKRFNEAIKKFEEYIKRFPDGKRIRDAYFSIGNCYSQMRQFNDADVWYGNALERWPALEDIPEDTLLKLGSHYLQTGKYDNALEFFFVCLNLFPDGKHCSDTLYKIARSFEAMGQLRSALKALSLVVERYPGNVEARNSALIIANIGVKNPGIKLPVYIFPGMDYYGDPIETYEKMAGKLSDLDMEQELMFRKGDALMKGRKYREAFDNYCLLLAKFPYGTHRQEGEKKLVLSAGCLIDDLYSKKDYIAVSDVYFNSDKEVLLKNGDFDILFKIGNSLKEMGMLDHAAEFFDKMIGVFEKDKRVSRLLLNMAKIDYGRGCYEEAKKRLNGLHGNRLGVDKKTAIAAMKLLGDISYKEGFLKEAAGFYSKVLGSENQRSDVRCQRSDVRCQMSDVREKYADSLREMGLYSSALINYKRVLKNCGSGTQKYFAHVIMDSYEGLGDCLYNKGKYQQAILMYEQSLMNSGMNSGDGISEGEQNMWTLFNIGRGYANLGNKPMADKSFSSLKVESGNEFWSRVVDYYVADNNWTEKYGAYIGK